MSPVISVNNVVAIKPQSLKPLPTVHPRGIQDRGKQDSGPRYGDAYLRNNFNVSRVATAIDGKVAPVVKNLPTNSGDVRGQSLAWKIP